MRNVDEMARRVRSPAEDAPNFRVEKGAAQNQTGSTRSAVLADEAAVQAQPQGSRSRDNLR